jgi:hypothetical protein
MSDTKFIVKLKPGVQEFDMIPVIRELLKQICVGEMSYADLDELGIEDVVTDKSDPAGIVYHIVIASWEGEGGL